MQLKHGLVVQNKKYGDRFMAVQEGKEDFKLFSMHYKVIGTATFTEVPDELYEIKEELSFDEVAVLMKRKSDAETPDGKKATVEFMASVTLIAVTKDFVEVSLTSNCEKKNTWLALCPTNTEHSCKVINDSECGFLLLEGKPTGVYQVPARWNEVTTNSWDIRFCSGTNNKPELAVLNIGSGLEPAPVKVKKEKKAKVKTTKEPVTK